MKKNLRVAVVSAALIASAAITNTASASLIFDAALTLSGTGLGAVNSLVTFQNTGEEIGAVGILPGGATDTGAAYAWSIPGYPLPGGPTHEVAAAGNNAYTAAGLGITSFSNVVVLFNGNEINNAAGQPITLENMALNLYDTTSGSLLGSFSTDQAHTFSAFPGVGSAGFAFRLDATQAANADIILAAFPTLSIGASARASGSDDGPDTVFISTLAAPSVPDSGATVALLGLGLLCLAAVGRRRK